jgi:hypothetical protein
VFQANVLNVMIASPGDVADERKIVTEEIHRWNNANSSARRMVLLPIRWETHSTPQMGRPPQEVLNSQLLDSADLVIGIFGTRIGTPTTQYISGTVEEIKRHVASGKTAKVYFSNVPIAPREINATQYDLVKAFQEECRTTGLYASFESIEDFARDFKHHLDIELNQPRYRWLIPPDTSRTESGPVSLTENALRLLKEAAATDDGIVILQETLGSTGLRVGEEEFMDGTTRSVAKWRAALSDLERAGALESVSEGIYRVTAAGFRIADDEEPEDNTTSAFEEHQRARTHELLDGLNDNQRDLLRLLMLHGMSARSDVIHRAWKNSSVGVDMNGLTKLLEERGIISSASNLREGYTTFYVNDSMSVALKKALFPRSESTTPNFLGIQNK